MISENKEGKNVTIFSYQERHELIVERAHEFASELEPEIVRYGIVYDGYLTMRTDAKPATWGQGKRS